MSNFKLPERPEARSDILVISAACSRLQAINLASGIPAAPAAPAAVEGAVGALYGGQNRYSDSRGLLSLRRAVSERLARQSGLPYDPEQEVLITTGVTGGFAACAMALFAKGDEVIVIEPFFGWHVRLLRLAGLTPRFVPLRGESLALDPEALRAAVGPRTRGLVICTPNNPCGKVWTREELAAVEALALEAGLVVITDEQYQSFCFDDRDHVSPASVGGLRAQTVTLGGFSKSLSVTGWRLGYAAAPAQLADAVHMMHQTLYICPATPLQHGVVSALPGLDMEPERRALQENRDLLCDALREAGFRVRSPEGGFFAMADAREISRLTSRDLAMTLLERIGVGAVPGRAFYDGGDHGAELRFCFARPRALLEEACRRLRNIGPDTLQPRTRAAQRGPIFDLRPITEQPEIDAAAALAYRVYVEEMGILGHLADHEQRLLYADDDAGTTVIGAFAGGQLAGCISLMMYNEAPFPPFYQTVFQTDRLAEATPLDGAAIFTRLLVEPAHRGSTLSTQLMGTAMFQAIARGMKLALADSQPHLVPSYERIGLRPYGAPFNYGESGIGVTLVGGTFELDRTRRAGSPLAMMLPPEMNDPAAAARLEAVLGEDRPVYSARTAPERYAALLEAGIEAIRSAEDAIFYGFSADELRRLFQRGYILDCEAGTKLIGRGQRTRTVFVVLEGELETRLRDGDVRRHGVGEVLGEIAYLTSGERTADVWVVSERARVLCLGEKTMRGLREGDPALAARFLGNLARILAQRLAR